MGVAYNAAGNLLTKSDLGTYRYPANGATRPNGVLEVRPYTGGSIGYTYDGNGNVGTTTSSGTASGYEAKYTGLTYTSFNLPDSSAGVAGSNGVSYKWYYDERHARIKEMRGAPGSLDRVTWMLHPDKANGLGFEQEIGGTISNRHYLSAGGQVVGVLTSVGEHTSGAATTITASEYWIKDHLGSSGAVTNASGAVTQRFAYDPWGQRRFADGRADPTGTLVYDYPSASDRGFTGHEHLDDVGVIHMNGRLYDGRIGRFLQADPVIQELARYQGFNRYSYVLNNPLNATDPTGEFIPQLVMAAAVAYLAYENPKMRPIASIMVGVILAIPSGGGSLAFTLEGAAQVAFAGFASGATASGNLRGGFQGAGMGLAFFGAGYAASTLGTSLSATGLETAFNLGSEAAGSGWTAAGSAFSSSGGLGRAALHAAAGCASAAISGADCGRGALTAGLNKMLAGNLPGDAMPFGLVKYSVIGGTIASVGGGKFANGAMMGAFQYLFNECVQTRNCGTGPRDTYEGSVPVLDRSGRLVLGADGKPLLIPEGFDLSALIKAGEGVSGNPFALYGDLRQFRIGGPWDLQRTSGEFDPRRRDVASFAIGVYAGAAGMGAFDIGAISNIYATFYSNFATTERMHWFFRQLPERNFSNNQIGIEYYRSNVR